MKKKETANNINITQLSNFNMFTVSRDLCLKKADIINLDF